MTQTIFAKIVDVKLAGPSFYQEQLWALRKADKAYLTLRREPNNKHDVNAIQVLAHAISKNDKQSVYQIGYVPKNMAVWLAKAMDKNMIVRLCNYKFVGGYNKKTLGLRLDVVHHYAGYVFFTNNTVSTSNDCKNI